MRACKNNMAADINAKKKADAAAKKKAEAKKESDKKAAADSKGKAKKYTKMGIGALKAGNAGLALKYFKKAQSMDPDNTTLPRYIDRAKKAMESQ